MHRGTPGHMRLPHRLQGQKSRSRGQLMQRSEMCQYFANGKSYDLQIWHAHRPWAVLAPDHKLAPKWAWSGVRDPISKFWDPLNISQTGKATIFKFGTHIGRGQFLPPYHKLARNWPKVSRGGGILWRPPSRTACYLCVAVHHIETWCGYVIVLC